MPGQCLYRENTPSGYEKKLRHEQFDLKRTKCRGQEKVASAMIEEHQQSVNLHGCSSVLDLLNVRANGEPVDDVNEVSLASRTICYGHFHSLVLMWEEGKGERVQNKVQPRVRAESSSVKCVLFHKTSAEADESRVVDKAMSINWLKRDGSLIPPGVTVCKRHQQSMKEGHKLFQKKTEEESDPIVDFEMDVVLSENEMDVVVDDTVNMDDDPRVERNLPPEAIAAVIQLVESIEGDRVITRGRWDELAENTKRKKGYLARRIFEVVCEVITPDGKEDLYHRATNQARHHDDRELADRVFDAMDERYAGASSTRERVELLSLVADLPGMTQKDIIHLIPSATLHYLNLARIYNKGGMDFEKKYRRERFDEKKNDRFVEWLTRANVLVSLAWGDSVVTLSDGTNTAIASVARKFSFARMHRMYIRDLEMSGELHLKLGRGSTTRILKVLAKRQNECKKCVDEFAVDAYEGWRQLTAVVEELREIHGLIGDADERGFKRWIRISRSHLEGEYISEVCESSNVRQHCANFSLSDPSRKCYANSCDHLHVGECKNCSQLDLLLSNLEALTERFAHEASTTNSPKIHRLKRLREIVDFSCQNLRSYQSHLLRTALSNSGRTQIIDSLTDGQALLTLDFGMKILPVKAVEGQSDFYAKKGIALHISHALAKMNGTLVDHVFAHTLDDVKQDGPLVYSIVRHVLCILESKGISKVFIRSDNAGSYKCAALISSLFHLSSPKMVIAGYYFSESQSGKGACDRACAHCKRKMREWTSSENNICCAHNIFESLTVENEVVRGLSTYFCTFNDSTTKIANVFPGISHFFSFDFEDDGVRTRCQYGIGEGKITEKDLLPTINCTLDIVEEGGHIDDSFWNSLDSGNEEKEIVDEENEEILLSEMLLCSTPGCLKSFRTTRWLTTHETIGKHEFAVKKESMTDHAVTIFNQLIETRETARIAVTEQVEASGDVNEYEHKKGWALKSSHKTQGLDKTAKIHAEVYFHAQRSLNPPRRAEGLFMRKKLEEAMDPSDPTKYLLEYSKVPTEKQLTSLFTRLEKSRLAGPKPSKAKAAKIPKTTTPITATPIKRTTRSQSSVRTPRKGGRKRTVVMESEESEPEPEPVQVAGEEGVGEEDEEDEEAGEMPRQDEDDYVRMVIHEEMAMIYQ